MSFISHFVRYKYLTSMTNFQMQTVSSPEGPWESTDYVEFCTVFI